MDERQPESVTAAVQTDDRLTSLVALRDALARAIDGCDSLRDLAALSARLTDVLQQIEAIPNKAEVSAADEIAARRAARRTNSATQARA
jgi:hypothetical protein